MGGEEEDFEADKQAEAEARASMGNFGVEELLREGHEALLRELVVKVKAGTASKDDKAQLRQMLKDNGMVWPELAAKAKPSVNQPTIELPELEEPDYDN